MMKKKLIITFSVFILGIALILTTMIGVKRASIKNKYNKQYDSQYVIIKQKLTKVKKGYMIETIYLHNNADCVYISQAFYNSQEKKFYIVWK